VKSAIRAYGGIRNWWRACTLLFFFLKARVTLNPQSVFWWCSSESVHVCGVHEVYGITIVLQDTRRHTFVFGNYFVADRAEECRSKVHCNFTLLWAIRSLSLQLCKVWSIERASCATQASGNTTKNWKQKKNKKTKTIAFFSVVPVLRVIALICGFFEKWPRFSWS